MKRNRISAGATMLSLGSATLIFLTGCSTHLTPNCCAKIETSDVTKFTDKSLFQTESKWITDHGKQIKLADLGGRPQVIVMFFASCQYACPIIVNDMKRIESALPKALRDQVGFTLVTFDTQRDTPAVLANYRVTRKLPTKSWTLLRGDSDDVLELAALLGVKYKQDANGQFAHSNVITLLNAQGEIVRQQIGLGQDPGELVDALEKLLAN